MTIKLFKTFLVDRATLLLQGEDVNDFLQNIISNNIDLVTKDQSIYSTLLNPQGKFMFDFILFKKNNLNEIYLDCDKNRAEQLIKTLNLYKLRKNVQISILNKIKTICVYGEDKNIFKILKLNSKEGSSKIINTSVKIVDPRNKNLGIRIYKFNEKNSINLSKIKSEPISKYDELRINLVIPDSSKDLEIGKSFLLENNFDELKAIDFKKGCYIGQENTARQKYRGTHKKILAKVKIYGKNLKNGTKIIYKDRHIGNIRSSTNKTGLVTIRTEVYQEFIKNNSKISVLNSYIKFKN